MCGIWGRFTDEREISREELVHPVRTLAHRGPDSYGWFLEPHAALVHTRLSIVDLSGGAQPLLSHDNRYIGIVNGELYDYHQHRLALEAKGVAFRTQSDSEVLLNLFATGGASALGSLSGEYAFIFVDREEGSVYFGRDLHGVKPLFFSQQGRELTLASEVKALSSEKPKLDPMFIDRFLAKMVIPPRTAIEGAFHVLPGRLYRFRPATGEVTWVAMQRLPFSAERPIHLPEAIERLREELSASVRRRLVADVEVGCYLSGGLDSALVAALMVQNGARPKAFTVGFTEAAFDERHKAARIAQHLGIPHHVTELNESNFLASFIRSIVAYENPVANAHGAAKNLLSALASQSVKVVLSGEGADEWFGGYAYFRIKKLKEFTRRHPKISGKALAQLLAKENPEGSRHLGGTSSAYDSMAAHYFDGIAPAIFGRLPSNDSFELIAGQPIAPLLEGSLQDLSSYYRDDVDPRTSTEDNVNMWAALRTDLLHYILSNLGDRQEMSNALEGRTPFLDSKVAGLAAQLDASCLLKSLVEKQVLREIAGPLLPSAVRNEKKYAFFSPMQYLSLPAVKTAMDDYIAIARKEMSWLPWARLNAFVTDRHGAADSFAHPFRKTLRVAFFSAGVLVDQLRVPQLPNPRGYRLPESAADLAPYQRVVES